MPFFKLNVPDITAYLVLIATACAVIGYVVKALKAGMEKASKSFQDSLIDFHESHVKPTIDGISDKIEENTRAMAESNREHQNSRAESKRAAEQLAQALMKQDQRNDEQDEKLDDHETRLTLTESQVADLKGVALTKKRAAIGPKRRS